MIRTFALIALTLAGLLSANGPVQALDRLLTPEEEQLIRDINAHNSAIETMAGRFLQVDTAGNRAEGVFYLSRPDHVRFRYAPPSREEIISNGNGFWVINRMERTREAYPQDQVPLRQFLTDDINLLNANLVDVVSSDDFISVVISDETPIGVVEVALIFEIASLDLKQWTLTEPSGAELTFSLYDVVTGVEIPSHFFTVAPFTD